MLKLINHKAWKNLAQYSWENDGPVPQESCVVYVPMDHITSFFKQIRKLPYKYIVISADSDYGLVLQEENPVWADTFKWLYGFVKIDENLGYQDIQIPGRCIKELCKLTDKYSVKMYAFTQSTFDEIPDNVVRWYATNVNVADEKIVHIPFGIPDWSENLIQAYRDGGFKVFSRNKEPYAQFQPNTAERLFILKNAKNNGFAIDVDENGSLKTVSHEEFIDKLTKSRIVISPCGNGFDSFRILESIYCGAIPAVQALPYTNEWIKAYEELPITVFKVKQDGKFEFMDFDPNQYDWQLSHLENTRADMNYWITKISEEKNSL